MLKVLLPHESARDSLRLSAFGEQSVHDDDAWRSSPEPEHSVRGGAKAGAVDRGIISPSFSAGWHSMQAMPQQATVPVDDEQVLGWSTAALCLATIGLPPGEQCCCYAICTCKNT